MPTDEERRKVAQRLRESRESVLGYRGQLEEVGINLFCFDQADYYLIYKSVYGFIPAEHMNTCDYAEFHGRLADLIDPEPERTQNDDERRRVSGELERLVVHENGVTSLNHGVLWSIAAIVLPDIDERPRETVLADLIKRLAELIKPEVYE